MAVGFIIKTLPSQGTFTPIEASGGTISNVIIDEKE
jgi:hypothetical protein